MTLRTVRSSAAQPSQAVAELAKALDGHKSAFLLYFASSAYDPKQLGDALFEHFGAMPAIGCTTAGEITSGEMLERSVVALALDAESVANGFVASVDLQAPDGARRALDALAEQAGTPAGQLDPARYVGLVLHDGLSVSEERVMEALGDLTNVPFIGGSAGDDAKFEKTHVFSGFTPLSGAAVLCLLELRRPYHILKTQSFDVVDETLEVTKVDEATRTVHELNGQPAAVAYAAAIGVPKAELAKHFQSNPLGLVLPSGEPFVRSPQQVKGDSVVFYCQVKEGMELKLLRARDIVEDTRRDLEAKLAEVGSCQGLVNFHCILRTLELQAKEQCDAYGAIFENVPTVGFSTYGESYIGHINQTSTMLLFT